MYTHTYTCTHKHTLTNLSYICCTSSSLYCLIVSSNPYVAFRVNKLMLSVVEYYLICV